ncbi:hypothetical protein [Paenilisteria rocourtiae]|uniref:Uncharacterized protein n=1 Tax=Listeria rocourtiae TaxID=647910 RepID=A0A4R6ZN82_9LIST|nr:hypothetical protein [Listeria rocourtiae]EUJ51053.1 hypothetical protein PROCOU_03054 [Listeria rocourtiae FSL F6-920]MBC1436326.1 hypothetical protein [Listeria rocourtiae]MBC1603591.1 hypothetical protein [Listeria rocourtiae]TDR53947.1 hypothetical protein DFP96_10343 [Listeria rocourtiae]
MQEKLISNEITRLFSKEIFRFAEFWFDNYYSTDMNDQVLQEHPEFIQLYRTAIVRTVSNGLRAISGGGYSQLDYYNLGKAEAQNGLKKEDALRNRDSFEAAMEAFLMKRKQEGAMEVTNQEINYYLNELKTFHDIIMPFILQGYSDYAKE